MTSASPRLISINLSSGGIPKLPVLEAGLQEGGLVGDGHDHEKHNTPVQAVSVLDAEDLDDLRAEGFAIAAGATGENLTVRGLDVDRLHVGDRLRFSGGAEIELTKRRKPCFVLDAIDPRLKLRIEGRCGYYGRTVTGGVMRPGEAIAVVPVRVPVPVREPVIVRDRSTAPASAPTSPR